MYVQINCITYTLHTVPYCTVLYCNVLYCSALYCTVVHCTVLYCTVVHCTVLYCTILYCTAHLDVILYCRNSLWADLYDNTYFHFGLSLLIIPVLSSTFNSETMIIYMYNECTLKLPLSGRLLSGHVCLPGATLHALRTRKGCYYYKNN